MYKEWFPPCTLFQNWSFVCPLQNPAIADIYTEHAHQVTVAKYAPSGFYIASGGKCSTCQSIHYPTHFVTVFHGSAEAFSHIGTTLESLIDINMVLDCLRKQRDLIKTHERTGRATSKYVHVFSDIDILTKPLC